MPGGRPTKLTPELIIKAHDYLEPSVWKLDDSVVPTIEGFGLYLGISRDTVYEWEKAHKAFSDITTSIRQEQSKLLINGALGNKFNSTIAKLLLSSKHGYVEKTATDVTTNGESINPDPTLAADYTEFMKGRK